MDSAAVNNNVIAHSLMKLPSKVVIFLRAVGNAPLLKQNKFKVSSHQPFLYVHEFVRRQLMLQERDPLFLYVNSAFAPSPDSNIDELFACYSIEDMLIINYSTNPAWG